MGTGIFLNWEDVIVLPSDWGLGMNEKIWTGTIKHVNIGNSSLFLIGSRILIISVLEIGIIDPILQDPPPS